MITEGVFSAIVTPFTGKNAEEVNVSALKSVVEVGVKSGLDGFVASGGTGEFATLTVEERRLVVETVCEASAGRASVIAQVGGTSTAEAVGHARHAEKVGANAIMLATPFYESVTFDQIRAYYHSVAEATSLPICIYNFPPAMGDHWNVENISSLMAVIPTVQFIKDSSGDYAFLNALRASESQFGVFCGEDILAGPAFLQGTGIIVGATNFCAPGLVKMYKSARAGQLDDFSETWKGLLPLILAVIGGHYNGGVKAACRALGLDVGPIRAPYNDLAADRIELINKTIAATDESLLNWA
ncbi:dihydrodipicolinate synthase family protein [Pantoea vagans]|uniref:dihydrodipicolinate synthase family protein n=1 Tax=Pantoea vagans TaxID=470934 RepID=UPI003017FBE0